MTEITTRLAGLPAGQVIGSGTILDTARFRSLLADHFGVSPQSVHAWVLGEHGESEVLCWSSASIGSIGVDALASQRRRPLDAFRRATIDAGVRRAADRIIAGKGATWYGIGGAIARIVQAIAADERAVMALSCRSDLGDGLGPVALSLPRIVCRGGAGEALWPHLDAGERQALAASAAILRMAAAAAS